MFHNVFCELDGASMYFHTLLEGAQTGTKSIKGKLATSTKFVYFPFGSAIPHLEIYPQTYLPTQESLYEKGN